MPELSNNPAADARVCNMTMAADDATTTTTTTASPPTQPRRRCRSSGTEVLCWVCALGYMAPWTFVGCLIAYVKAARSANYYVEIYGLFYALGYPAALLQQRYDAYWDTKLGSTWTFLWRGQASFGLMLAVTLAMPLALEEARSRSWPALLAAALLGLATWTLHGTASQLASVCGRPCISALQTGFRTPEVLALAACAGLRVGSEATTENALRLFFALCAALVAAGLLAWTLLLGTPSVRKLLEEKDGGADSLLTISDADELRVGVAERLLAAKTSSPASPVATRLSSKPKKEASPVPSKEERDLVRQHSDELRGGAAERLLAAKLSYPASPVATRLSSKRKKQGPPVLLNEEGDLERGAASLTVALSTSETDEIRLQTRPCRVALFCTMFGSIFTAAFFAYATSTRSGRDIEQALYFTRLFGDLVGRPLASLPRPAILQDPSNLAAFAVARLAFSALFFAYVFVPGFPQSDVFVLAYVALFSVSSGYIGILAYDVAARDAKGSAAKSYATTLMNSTFQLSMFLAVLLGILVSELIS